MTEPMQPDSDQLRQVLSAIGSDLRLVTARPMDGGVSATTTLIEVQTADGERQRLVLRQHGAAPGDDPRNPRAASQGDTSRNPRAAADAGVIPHMTAANECRLLGMLHAAGFPVPRPLLADESGAILPGPFVVMEFVNGAPANEPPEPAGFTSRLAATLARLHSEGIARATVPFLPDIRHVAYRRLGTSPAVPDDSLSEATIRAALARSWPPPLVGEPTVLHGDYWPGNTLWRDGQLVAVIDWEDAAFGDPLADVGNARLELAMAFGAAAVRDFTHHYRAAVPDIDLAALPYWDLYAALRPTGKMADWGLDKATLDRFRTGHREFADAARRLV